MGMGVRQVSEREKELSQFVDSVRQSVGWLTSLEYNAVFVSVTYRKNEFHFFCFVFSFLFVIFFHFAYS